MGVIQNAINQIIGSVGIGSKLISSTKQKRDRANEAMLKVANTQDAAQKQRRNFINYLKDMPSSIGGKVGELPIEIQRQIAKTYSTSERKNIMDTVDKGGKK